MNATYRSVWREAYYSAWKCAISLLTLGCMALRDVAQYVGRKADQWAMDGHRQISRLGEVEDG